MSNHRIWMSKGMLCTCITSVIVLFSGTRQTPAEMTNSVSQYGITWMFDEAYEVGRFANGDYWVRGPVTLVAITPDFDGMHNGWEVNPVYSGGQGFEKGAGSFDAELVPNLPYTAQPGESIVKGISTNQVPGSAPDCYAVCLDTAAVLTVVPNAPPGDGADVFRPAYVGNDKTYYPISSIRTDLLPSLSYSGASAPSLATVHNWFRRVQLDHKGGRPGRIIKPRKNLPDYGGAVAQRVNAGIARVLFDDPIGDKMGALIAILQAGIDRYHALLSGQTWPAGGGHEPGRKLSLAFTAYLLDHQDMKTRISESKFFSEDLYIQKSKDGSGRALFGGTRHNSETRYWEYVVNPPPYNLERHDWYGYIDGGSNIDRDINGYQSCCLSQPWKGSALILELIPPIKTFWNNDLLLNYIHRFVNEGTVFLPDPCAPPDIVDFRKDSSEWTQYGITWGSDGQGGCIRGSGRFPEHHGKYIDAGGYRNGLVDDLWDMYVGTNGSPTRLSPPTDLRVVQ